MNPSEKIINLQPVILCGGLDIVDMEHAVLAGRVVRIDRDDPRGNKHVIEGMAADGVTPVGVVGRFTGGGRYLIITIYAIT